MAMLKDFKEYVYKCLERNVKPRTALFKGPPILKMFQLQVKTKLQFIFKPLIPAENTLFLFVAFKQFFLSFNS